MILLVIERPVTPAAHPGDPHAAEQLLPLVYDELRQLAAQKLAQEKPGQTLQAIALVHEAYLRLVDSDQTQHWNSRGHFFAAAAEAMRRNLVESVAVACPQGVQISVQLCGAGHPHRLTRQPPWRDRLRSGRPGSQRMLGVRSGA